MPLCKGKDCGKSIFYVQMPNGTNMPVDLSPRLVIKVRFNERNNAVGEYANTDMNAGPVYGVSHYLTCRNANDFGHRKKKAEAPHEAQDHRMSAAGENTHEASQS